MFNRLLLTALVACAGCTSEPVPPKTETQVVEEVRPRRVLLVTIDTLRADVLGTYGGAALTPELDRWAKSGWRFDRAYSASMLTNPSHASILTSLHPRDHGVYDNESGVASSLRTLPREFKRHGFATGAVVAFPHLNPNVVNLGRGFDRFVPAKAKERRAGEQVALALSEMAALGSDSFFFWLHLGDPHAPYDPVGPVRPIKPAKTPTDQALRASPGFQRNNEWFRQTFREIAHTETFFDRYVAEVESVDRALIRLREQLQEADLWDDMLVVVTSDHGENFGEHNLWFHHGGLYDSTLHVPLIVRGPGVEPALDHRLVEHVDIAPTVVDLMGLPLWEPMRGRSIHAQRKGLVSAREFAFSEHMQAQAVSVRMDGWTAIVHRKNSKQFPTYPWVSGTREYWRRLPHGDFVKVESNDDGQPEMRRLDRAIARYLGSGLALHAKKAVGQDRDSLRALGYIE